MSSSWLGYKKNTMNHRYWSYKTQPNLSGGTLGYEHPNSRHIVWKRWQRTAQYRRQSRIWITIYEIRPVKIRFIPAILIERVPNNLDPLRTYI